jgi:hypothetical protein
MPRRGQVAIEFLMLYGWAFLIVLAAIALLAYTGVFNPGRFIKEGCMLDAGIGCIGHAVKEDAVILVLQNGKDEDLSISSITVEGCAGNASGTLTNGNRSRFTIGGCSNAAGARFNGNIRLSYAGDSGLAHTMGGSVVDVVDAGSAS